MLTVQNLREVVEFLKLRFDKQVPETDLFRAIMEKVGASQRSRRNAAEAIHIMGFMRPVGNGLWEFDGEYAPAESPKPIFTTAAEDEEDEMQHGGLKDEATA